MHDSGTAAVRSIMESYTKVVVVLLLETDRPADRSQERETVVTDRRDAWREEDGGERESGGRRTDDERRTHAREASRARPGRVDVAEADGRHAHHREVERVDEREVTVEVEERRAWRETRTLSTTALEKEKKKKKKWTVGGKQ